MTKTHYDKFNKTFNKENTLFKKLSASSMKSQNLKKSSL